MKAKNWIAGWLVLVLTALLVIGAIVIETDPYFHYHKPDLENYYYQLDNERYQNNGIIRFFDYDAVLTGTSMVENSKTSELDELFGVHSIKVPFAGATFKEINDNLKAALADNPEIHMVFRCLDYEKFLDDKDLMREDMGVYPAYLYDSNPLNDVNYLFSKDVVFNRSMIMLKDRIQNRTPGITSFDEYYHWQKWVICGKDSVLPDGITPAAPSEAVHLTEEDKRTVYENITQNVTSLADEYPDVEFYFFFSPYSAAWWQQEYESGEIYRQIEAEGYAVELILQHPNIHLYSFNTRTDIVTDLNNYKDIWHYGDWINSLMLRWIKDGSGLLTAENYREYLDEELEFYTTFDYSSLNSQTDYENDFYAAALLNREYSGAEPLSVLEDESVCVELTGAEITEDRYENEPGIRCTVSDAPSGTAAEARIGISDIGEHRYLVFYAKETAGTGLPAVRVYNDLEEQIAVVEGDSFTPDNEWHMFVVDLSNAEGGISVVFSVEAADDAESAEAECIFSGITLY